MMSEDGFDADKQFELLQTRMTNTMRNMRQWLKVTFCSWGAVAVITLVTAIVAVVGIGWPGYDADAVEVFIGVAMKVVNVILVAMYASAAIAVAYFLRYVYLDNLLKKHARVVE
jgi:hypothetical protein